MFKNCDYLCVIWDMNPFEFYSLYVWCFPDRNWWVWISGFLFPAKLNSPFEESFSGKNSTHISNIFSHRSISNIN